MRGPATCPPLITNERSYLQSKPKSFAKSLQSLQSLHSKKDSKLRIDATLINLNNPEDASVINNIFFTAGYDDPNHVGVTITGSGVKDDLTVEMIESVQVSANTIFWEMSYESNTENNTVNGIINVSNADYLELCTD